MTERPGRSSLRRSVVKRVLWSYALVVLMFALVAGWGALALRRASLEAGMIRRAYYPLAVVVRGLAGKQDVYNAQLNHVTSAVNPQDLQRWLVAQVRVGRPDTFGQLRAAIHRAFPPNTQEVRVIGAELLAEVTAIERLSANDPQRLTSLFEALDRGEEERAERLRDELVRSGTEVRLRLSRLEDRVGQEIDSLLQQARSREFLAIQLLIGLSATSVLLGLAMALYTRRVLSPLAAVTARAQAVAEGDLEPRPPIASGDEIGELSATFEAMVSAIRRANEQLVANERLATIGKMAAHVTHEIRNPLSSIALNLELLEEELAVDSEESRALLRAIGAEVERLSSLSQQYLSFARQRSSSLIEEELSDVVRDAAEFSRRELLKAEIRLELELEEIGPIPLDEGQIKQAVFNLLRNARDAMPQGGSVRVSVRKLPGLAEVRIDDEGGGVDPEMIERLFEPFFSTKRHGTGLGLAITRQIVEAHGGKIELSANSPRGARVTIRLPRPELASSPTAASTAAYSSLE